VRHRTVDAHDVTGLERREGRIAADRKWRRQEWAQAGVGGASALDRVDELWHPKATIDEAQEEIQVGDKLADRQRSSHHTL
jgi:hypothetical protein